MNIWLLALATSVFTSHAYGQSVVEHQISLDGCNFNLSDRYNGRVSVDNESMPHSASYISIINSKARHPFETWIQFSCENSASAQTLSDLGGIKTTANGWALDNSPKVIGEAGQHTTFHPLQGSGWSGGGVTQDDIDGDEEQRSRVFAFCIPYRQRAVCGVARSVGYLEHLNEAVLPQVIQLLETLKFAN
ncbi:hypothetical protein [Paraburkholderia acidiphila]|uniref:Uncharacterized protein n=1 Tax=Paraburkholderia acidiphila TaxID=2571747 RepID=A0A7Z2JBY0_9BURK|nr:hypothetical protein [Paraburkholderia acidiphila]QGZ58298.1 hypothetical protein FAZ97_25185 [Paraburkholderia acidiphila]